MNIFTKAARPEVAAEKSSSAHADHYPRLEDYSPQYAELVSKRAMLLAEGLELFRRSMAVAEELRGTREKSWQPNVTEKAIRVADLLGEPRPEPPRDVAAMTTLEDIESRQRDIDEAVAELDRRIADERMKASAAIREKIAPQYRGLVTDICDRLIELHHAVARYEQFTDNLNARGIAWSGLLAMPCRFAGAQDRSSEVARYLREAADYKFIKSSKIPGAIR
ncbi:MAG: hypothetical protein EOS51_18125 [Mesorhizobium sp.]|uniref:hypothetical protein n=1 Tax=unclassified Mesorhizobium TaxID=325217 RepID=UPI000FE51E8A|nr:MULTISPECIES: hypothetical protein [unclassified Mesorhizobium]RWC17047.1 MAG: hypothetical protein EOS51_18125 [Mesorhizobium sp.]TGU01263.1 hypothetical protein EN807_16415 [Mesorhizobium sp. M5C.F.Ca.ET.164.01.1.1]